MKAEAIETHRRLHDTAHGLEAHTDARRAQRRTRKEWEAGEDQLEKGSCWRMEEGGMVVPHTTDRCS